jgi:hypothetical protein
MPITSILPGAAAGLFVLFLVVFAVRGGTPKGHSWVLPAAASALFLVFSLVTVVTQGPMGFWVEHTRNLWGNQIWFDLLLAAAVAWAHVWPEARRLGMNPWLWILIIVCSGSIGLLALVALVKWRNRPAGARVLPVQAQGRETA